MRSQDAFLTLVRYATGQLDHLNHGLCPDALEGPVTRDPDCPVCNALDVALSDSQPGQQAPIKPL